MFRKLILTAVLTALAISGVSARNGGQLPRPGGTPAKPQPANNDYGAPDAPKPDQEWRLGVDLTSNGRNACTVTRVYPGSPAAEIGLQVGDVVVSINGKLADDPHAMRDLVFASDKAVIHLYRGGSYYEAEAVFENQISQVPGGNGTTVAVCAKVLVQKKMKKIPQSAVKK